MGDPACRHVRAAIQLQSRPGHAPGERVKSLEALRRHHHAALPQQIGQGKQAPGSALACLRIEQIEMAQALQETAATGSDLVVAMLPVVDGRFGQHVQSSTQRCVDRQPFVVAPARRDRQRFGQQPTAQRTGGTGDEVAQQDRVDRKARAFQLDLGRMDHQYLQQLVAQRRALRVHQPRIAVQQQQARVGVEALHVAADTPRMPDIILVAKEQDVGLATHQCVGEIAHIAEIARVLDDLDTDAQRLCARYEGPQQR